MVALDLDKVVSERCQLSARPRGLLVYYHGFCEQDGLQLVCHLPGAMGCLGLAINFLRVCQARMPRIQSESVRLGVCNAISP